MSQHITGITVGVLLRLVLPLDRLRPSRSSAKTLLGNGVCMYIMSPITSGAPSWPRSTPVENVQATCILPTFCVLICVELAVALVVHVAGLHRPLRRVLRLLDHVAVGERGPKRACSRPMRPMCTRVSLPFFPPRDQREFLRPPLDGLNIRSPSSKQNASHEDNTSATKRASCCCAATVPKANTRVFSCVAVAAGLRFASARTEE